MRGTRPAAKLLLVGAFLVAGSLLIGFFAGISVKSPAQVLADTAPPSRTLLTETVEFESIGSTVMIDGKVERSLEFHVPAPSAVDDGSAASIVTRLPVKVGASLAAGDLAVEVSGRPVFVLPGKLPSFRTLSPGATGSDVTELQEGLQAAGLLNGSVDGRFGPSTSDAVRRLYSRRGYEPVEVGLDAVTTAEDAVREAERALKQADKGGDPLAENFAKQDLDRAEIALDEARSKAGVEIPVGEIVFVSSLPASVKSIATGLGNRATSDLMTLASGPLVARGQIEQTINGISRGVRARVIGDSGEAVAGRVTSVAAPQAQDGTTTPADSDGGSGGQDGVEVTISPRKPLDPETLGTYVRVSVEVSRSPGKALVVPVSAIWASNDGANWVTVVADGQTRHVEVTPGFTGDGLVQVQPISADELHRGDLVSVGSRG